MAAPSAPSSGASTQDVLGALFSLKDQLMPSASAGAKGADEAHPGAAPAQSLFDLFKSGGMNPAQLVGQAQSLLEQHGAEIQKATGMDSKEMAKKAQDLLATNPDMMHKLEGLLPQGVMASLTTKDSTMGHDLVSAMHSLKAQFLDGGGTAAGAAPAAAAAGTVAKDGADKDHPAASSAQKLFDMFKGGKADPVALLGQAHSLLEQHGAEITKATGMEPQEMAKKAQDLLAAHPDMMHQMQGLLSKSVKALLSSST